MSGHSKWANIKHKKGKADAARGKTVKLPPKSAEKLPLLCRWEALTLPAI